VGRCGSNLSEGDVVGRLLDGVAISGNIGGDTGVRPGQIRRRGELGAGRKTRGARRRSNGWSQSVDDQAASGADVNFAIGHGRNGELDYGAKAVGAASLLTAIPQFGGKGGGVVGVNLVVTTIHHPGDAISGAVGRDNDGARKTAEFCGGLGTDG